VVKFAPASNKKVFNIDVAHQTKGVKSGKVVALA
jgi:hypothetical protein